MAEIRGRLEQPGVRLLTLTGPGGAGKTRLALQVATELVEAYPDGVWFVPLAPVASATLVAATIAGALGIRETAADSIEATLRAYLRPRRLLLVLDNFEHVVDASPLVADLLSQCPDIQVLATSRAPLHLSGEHELPVPSLELPPAENGLRVDDALASEAVRLFVDRARAVQSHFELTEDNVEAVVAICRRLDGLPLAIELAASRVRLLPPKAILARLDSRLTLLTGGGRDRPERQQTLRGAIAWSHDLLDGSQQTLFRRLGVFAGGWTFEAAEAVVGFGDRSTATGLRRPRRTQRFQSDPPPGVDRMEMRRPTLASSCCRPSMSLPPSSWSPVASSSRRRRTTRRGSWTWPSRPNRSCRVRRPSPGWIVSKTITTTCARHSIGSAPRAMVERAVTLAAAMWRFWWLRGHITEGRKQLETALAVDGATAAAARATALDGAGVLAETQGDYDRAEALHREALALSRERDDKTGIARALGNLGVVAFDRGDDDQATALLEESLALAREIGDQFLVATALNDLGAVAFKRADLEGAERLYQESLSLRRRAGSGSEIARALNNLGSVAYCSGGP